MSSPSASSSSAPRAATEFPTSPRGTLLSRSLGKTSPLPLHVDQLTGAEAALGAYKLVVCLAPDDVRLVTLGSSPNGARLLDATFLASVTTPFATNARVSTVPAAFGTLRPYGVVIAFQMFCPAGTVNPSSTVKVASSSRAPFGTGPACRPERHPGRGTQRACTHPALLLRP